MLIPQILTPSEQAFMQQVWPQIRVAARLTDVNWASHGYPGGPLLSPPAFAALAYVWPQIRVAANWTDPRWENHPVPDSVVAAAMPVPEAPAAPAPYVPSAPADPIKLSTPSYDPIQYVPGAPLDSPPDPQPEAAPAPAVKQAGLFSGMSWPVMLGLTALGFVLFGKPKFPSLSPRRRRRR